MWISFLLKFVLLKGLFLKNVDFIYFKIFAFKVSVWKTKCGFHLF